MHTCAPCLILIEFLRVINLSQGANPSAFRGPQTKPVNVVVKSFSGMASLL